MADVDARVPAEETLRPLFAGFDPDRPRRHRPRFVGHALGGPNRYAGRNWRHAHAGPGVTAARFAAVAGHLAAALAAWAVPGHPTGQVIAHAARLEGDVAVR